MTVPNFFLAGAAKSGTTTLYEALRSHPDVFIPSLKEPHFYAYLAEPSTSAHLYADVDAARRLYRDLYREAAGESAVGDCSTTNLVVPGAAELMAREVPTGRIVAILRQPVDRAFSHFCHFVTAGGEPLHDFADAVAAEPTRRSDGHPFTYQYLGWSRYSAPLRRFLGLFGRDRVLVHLYDDLCADPEAVVRTTFAFLGVDDSGPLPPVGRFNEVRSPTVAVRPARRVRLPGRRQSGAATRPRPTLDPGLRAELTASFAGEIDRLEDLLGRDLTAWRLP